MNMALDEKVNIFVQSKPQICHMERLSWNARGVLYAVFYQNKKRKSMFATCFESNRINLKEKYQILFNDSKIENIGLIECESIDFIEENQMCYVFVIMENVIPLLQLILEDKYIEAEKSDIDKKIKLLSHMEQICRITEWFEKKYPDINMFINNEEICVDDNGNARLLLFDMIKNDIATNNQAYEIEHVMKHMANGIGVSIDEVTDNMRIADLHKNCINIKEKLIQKSREQRERFVRHLKAAEQGKKKAYASLGYMYEHGIGTKVSYEKALEWYKKGAACGETHALNNIAHLYQKGLGVRKDMAVAFKYLEKSAKKNNPLAQFNLAMAYQKGKGVQKDIKKAGKWYKKSSKNGNLMAKCMYENIKNNY